MSHRAEEARQLKEDGYTIPEIVEKMGVKRAWVYNLLRYEKYQQARRENKARNRRRLGQMMYQCSVCEEYGHNARRHKK